MCTCPAAPIVASLPILECDPMNMAPPSRVNRKARLCMTTPGSTVILRLPRTSAPLATYAPPRKHRTRKNHPARRRRKKVRCQRRPKKSLWSNVMTRGWSASAPAPYSGGSAGPASAIRFARISSPHLRFLSDAFTLGLTFHRRFGSGCDARFKATFVTLADERARSARSDHHLRQRRQRLSGTNTRLPRTQIRQSIRCRSTHVA